MSVAQKFYLYQLQGPYGPGSEFWHFSFIILKLENCHFIKLLPNISYTSLGIVAASTVELIFYHGNLGLLPESRSLPTWISLGMKDNSSDYTLWHKPSQSRCDSAILANSYAERLLCQNFLNNSLSNTTFSLECTFLAQLTPQNADIL